MKIAIPLFDKRISPRFDCAQSFLLAAVENGDIIEREELFTALWTPLKRVNKLSDLGVDMLICGGIDRVSLQRLMSYGVKVHSWVTGRAEDALHSLLKGELEPGIMVGPGGRRRGKWRFRGNKDQWGRYKRGQGKGRGKQSSRHYKQPGHLSWLYPYSKKCEVPKVEDYNYFLNHYLLK